MRRRDFVSKRRLTSPSQILNASKDGGGSFDRCCSLQNNWFVMVRNNELLYSPIIDDVPTIKVPRTLVAETKPAVIQSFVLDCETCERLSRCGVFFALTCEFSVLAGVKFGTETFTFNEIVDSFYEEDEIDQALIDSPTTMFMPNYPDLLVITTLRKIVLISIDIDAIINDVEQVELPSVHSSYSDQEQVVDKEISRTCVRGVRVIETNADNYIFMDDVRLYHPSISEHIESIHTPVIMGCSMWSSQAQTQTQTQTGGGDTAGLGSTNPNLKAQMHYTLVFTGDANWIRFMPVVQGDADGVWEDLGIHDSGGNLSDVSPSTLITDHEVWITAVSKATDTASLYATGDQIGSLSFWRAKTNTKEGYSTYEQHFKVKDAASVQGAGIVSLTQAPHDLVADGLFVGDSSGAITCIKVDARNRVIETLWKTRLFTPDSGPAVSRWHYRSSSSSSANNDNNYGSGGEDSSSMVMVYSSALGIAYEYVVQKQVVSSFNAAYGNDATRQNKCAVEVCAVLIELDALVTASSLNAASIWRLSNGELITTVELPEYFVTSVAAYDTGYVVEGVGRIIFGFASGHTHDYLVQEVDKAAEAESYLVSRGGTAGTVPNQVIGSAGGGGSISDNNNGGGRGGRRGGGKGAFDEHEEGSDDQFLNDLQSVDIFDTLAGGALEDDDDGEEESVTGNGKASAGLGPDRVGLGLGQQKARATFANQCGNPWETIALSVQLQHSTDYCPMPVTDIFVSSLGLFFAFVFGRRQIVVHEWESSRALHQIQLDDGLVDISAVALQGLDDMDSDILVLALQGAQGVKILDAITGTVLSDHPFHMAHPPVQDMMGLHSNSSSSSSNRDPGVIITPRGVTITPSSSRFPQVCRMWFAPPKGAGEGTPNFDDLDLFGVCGGHEGAGFHAYSKELNLTPLLESLDDNGGNEDVQQIRGTTAKRMAKHGKLSSHLDNLVLGGSSISDFVCPLASIWTLRHSLLFRCHEGSITRIFDYRAADDKARVVQACALKLMPQVRAHRALVVMSDGNVFVLKL